MKQKLPVKVQAIKNLFDGDREYTVTTAVDPETEIHTLTIWWKNG